MADNGTKGSRIQAFIVSCLAHLLDPDRNQIGAPPKLDWEQVYQQLVAHKLTGLFYELGREQTLLWPDMLQRKLFRDYNSALLWGEQCSRESTAVLMALHQAEIPTIVLKGWALVPTVYGGDFGKRSFADIDILVPRWYAARAETILFDMGYGSLPEVWTGFSRRYENNRSFQLPHKPGPFGTVFAIGLHWELLDLPYFYNKIPEESLFERAISVSIAGIDVQALAPEDHIVYACGHLAMHHQYHPALFRAYEMAALILQAGSAMDWGTVVSRSTDWGLGIPAKRVLFELDLLWPNIIPPNALDKLSEYKPTKAERRLHQWVVSGKENHAIKTLMAWLTLPGILKKVGYFLETAFPSPAYMQKRYCTKHPGCWPLTYIYRAGLGFLYLLRAVNRKMNLVKKKRLAASIIKMD